MNKNIVYVAVGFLAVASISLKAEEPAAATDAVETPAKPAPARAKKIRKKRVIKSAAPAAAAPQSSATSAKIEDVQQAKKPRVSDSFQAWLKDMKKRVSHSQAQQNQIVAVAAVRGDETPDSPPLYWKGKKAEGPVNMPELKDFEAAVDVALSGDPAAAREKLLAFVSSYPKSSLVSDAKETLSRLDTKAPNP